MKIENLIIKLMKLYAKHGNLEVIIAGDENGWYGVDAVKTFKDEEGDKFINIESGGIS
jgi:hypothetical protein